MSKRSKQKQKMRGPSRPVDPRYTVRRIATARRGPDPFGIWLVGISTALVLLIVFWVVTANRGATPVVPTQVASNPQTTVVTSPPTPNAAQWTATTIAFDAETEGIPRISPEELKPLVEANNVKVVDVRVKASYDKQHIKGATSVPESDFLASVKEFPREGNLVVYCQ